MTTPDERLRSIQNVYLWLSDLGQGTDYSLGSKHRVPEWLRRTALALLRHYPSPSEMERYLIHKRWDE